MPPGCCWPVLGALLQSVASGLRATLWCGRTVDDGVVKAAIENDKLTRSRSRGLPEQAIQSCFGSVGAGWESVDLLAVASKPISAWARNTLLRNRRCTVAPVVSPYYEANEISMLAWRLHELRVLRSYTKSHKLITFDHHLCHAASAFYLSPFEESLIVTMDKDGDGDSATVSIGRGNRIRVLRKIAFSNSLAWVYSQVTDLLGFRPHQEEHKTQWLSLDGQPAFKDVFVNMLRNGRNALPRLDYAFFNRGLAKQLSFSATSAAAVLCPRDDKPRIRIDS